jgi:hypothetical protein
MPPPRETINTIKVGRPFGLINLCFFCCLVLCFLFDLQCYCLLFVLRCPLPYIAVAASLPRVSIVHYSSYIVVVCFSLHFDATHCLLYIVNVHFLSCIIIACSSACCCSLFTLHCYYLFLALHSCCLLHCFRCCCSFFTLCCCYLFVDALYFPPPLPCASFGAWSPRCHLKKIR